MFKTHINLFHHENEDVEQILTHFMQKARSFSKNLKIRY